MFSGFTSNVAAVGSQLSDLSATRTNQTRGGFSDLLKSALQGVDDLQAGADTNISAMLQGSQNTDLNKVMVSVEKADVAFQLMMQVRNKIVTAYQDIEKMQF